ncbi:MAG: cysteine desulfurase [Clostridia bacterium]|nr:cysteine desulfurase [Clostridia bacterium]
MNAYLDYAATTPLDKEILDKMLPYLTEEFGNPDSLHAYGRRAAYAVSEARDRVAGVLGVKPAEVYFTSGGTEADNWAMLRLSTGRLCVSSIEHTAVLSAVRVRTTYAKPNEDGIVTPQAVEDAINSDTRLVCVMAVNNETGCIQPIKEISALCKTRGLLLFSDCVQAAVTQDLKELCGYADAISLSGHKIYGPKGTGVLVVKKGVPLRPLIAGGEQERGLRGGTLNVPGVVGFSYALEKVQKERERFCKKTEALRAMFEDKLKNALGSRIRIDGTNRAPNISHITFAGGDALLNRLDLKGVCASGGAACSAHSALPSHVMLAMGKTEAEAKNGVRFSFGKHTTEAEINFAAQTVIECVNGL